MVHEDPTSDFGHQTSDLGLGKSWEAEVDGLGLMAEV
jgi:hypothetical protein